MVDRFCLLEPMASATRIIVQYGMIMMIEELSMKSLKNCGNEFFDSEGVLQKFYYIIKKAHCYLVSLLYNE